MPRLFRFMHARVLIISCLVATWFGEETVPKTSGQLWKFALRLFFQIRSDIDHDHSNNNDEPQQTNGSTATSTRNPNNNSTYTRAHTQTNIWSRTFGDDCCFHSHLDRLITCRSSCLLPPLSHFATATATHFLNKPVWKEK